MNTPKCFVFIHGAWHDHHTWNFVAPVLENAGHLVTALDLPGAGVNAKYPSSYLRRPFDPEAFAAEHSPNANVTQNERTDAVIAAVRELNEKSSSKAVLVGHSLGGLTVSHVAEAISDEPVQVTKIPSPITKKNFGRISRHYIQCTQDNAIPLAAQQEMVSLVDADMNNVTTVHSLESSHSPFFSHPEEFAQILNEIAES